MNDKFWLNKVVAEIQAAKPDGEIIVSSGVSPSGMYHIGSLREVLTADVIAWGLRQAGRKARHLHVVDDLDAFRKVPVNVPAAFSEYLGTPLHLVPAPDSSDSSYADYFFDQFLKSAEEIADNIEVVRSHERYQDNFFEQAIEKTIHNLDKVREIIESVSGRQLPKDWVPVQLMDDDNKFGNRQFIAIDHANKQMEYIDQNSDKGEMSYTDGRVKLDWRVDWPARWWLLQVDVEPFGRDHATKGGSYDTGKALIEQVFDASAPMPYPYEFINLKGETKKMSASAGTGILPEQALKLMPPEVLKYFILKSRPSLQLNFDSGLGFGRLIDEFRELERQTLEDKQPEMADAYNLATNNGSQRILSDIPYNHLVTAWQSSNKNQENTLDILSRSEHGEAVKTQQTLINEELVFIDAWLEEWAPDEVKFTIQESLPKVELNEGQKKLLHSLAEKLKEQGTADGQWFHDTIYAIRDEIGLEPKEVFTAVYRVILGQDFGPKAGWFLATLERKWLIERLQNV